MAVGYETSHLTPYMISIQLIFYN